MEVLPFLCVGPMFPSSSFLVLTDFPAVFGSPSKYALCTSCSQKPRVVPWKNLHSVRHQCSKASIDYSDHLIFTVNSLRRKRSQEEASKGNRTGTCYRTYRTSYGLGGKDWLKAGPATRREQKGRSNHVGIKNNMKSANSNETYQERDRKLTRANARLT